jgi:hypothetical protein
MTVEERFWSRVSIPGSPAGCWEFAGADNGKGYKQLSVDGKLQLAHRFAYELLVGPIPEGLTIDHLCRSTGCVNPLHLDAVSAAENYRRSSKVGRQRCVRGHDFTDENTYRSPGRPLVRVCRECRRLRARDRYHRTQLEGAR